MERIGKHWDILKFTNVGQTIFLLLIPIVIGLLILPSARTHASGDSYFQAGPHTYAYLPDDNITDMNYFENFYNELFTEIQAFQ